MTAIDSLQLDLEFSTISEKFGGRFNCLDLGFTSGSLGVVGFCLRIVPLRSPVVGFVGINSIEARASTQSEYEGTEKSSRKMPLSEEIQFK